MWIYIQRTGGLYRNSTHSDLVATGYAGTGQGKNNPAYECVQDLGPIPHGNYTIRGPVQGPSPYSLPLAAATGNNMCGRSGFFIHGDAIANPGNASHGCIVLSQPVRRQIWESGDRDLHVQADADGAVARKPSKKRPAKKAVKKSGKKGAPIKRRTRADRRKTHT